MENNENKIGTGIAPEKQAQAEPSQQPASWDQKFGGRKGRRGGSGFKPVVRDSEFVEKVVSINRCTKVTKGNKRLAFSALVVVGDGKGRVGYGLGKAGEVATAIKKSLIQAKKNMVIIPLVGSTIPHLVDGHWGSAKVMLRPASEGTGVIAAGPVRAICDAVGIRNILTKCHKSNNPINVVKATMDGLTSLKTYKRDISKPTLEKINVAAA